MSPQEQELRDLKDSLQDTQPVGSLVKCCKTLDQVFLNLAVFWCLPRNLRQYCVLGVEVCIGVSAGFTQA